MFLSRTRLLLSCLVLGALVTACSHKPASETAANSDQDASEYSPGDYVPGKYPEPRFPSYLKPPTTVDEVMPYARALVRNRSGFEGLGLGAMEPGQTVVIVVSADSEDMIMDAIQKALTERGVKSTILRDYELAGINRDDGKALLEEMKSYTSEKGYMEASTWMSFGFTSPGAPKKWLKERRPDLYEKLYPAAHKLPDNLVAASQKYTLQSVGGGVRDYLANHPEVKGVFWGKGGATYLKKAIAPYEDKLMGVFTADNRFEIMSGITTYPADVWQLSEDQTMEPLAFADKIHVTDPEGTDASADLTQVQSERWAKGAYHRGHLFLFPPQATGRFGYSVIGYPAVQKEYLPPEPLVLVNGVIAGTKGHTGFYPRWEIHFNNGYVSEVKGGGNYGELLRAFMGYPGINDLTYPFYKHPGYFYLHEMALGTNPKYFRNPDYMYHGSLIPERMHSGVFHFGLGLELIHDPDSPTDSKSFQKFGADNNMPIVHGWHTHNYFATYQVHLRNTDKWVTLVDKGHMTSLDNAEVRALASRYGDPDTILSEDWIPEMPGVNVPGRYQDYAADPWKFDKVVIDKALSGDYQYMYPKPKK
jgi:hypothetical protein